MSKRLFESGLKLAGILFLDVKGFSKLSHAQLERFMVSVWPELGAVIDPYRTALLDLNTWGDGIIAVSDNPVKLARLSLALRDYFRVTNFEEKSLPNTLQARISLHAGPVFIGFDPIRKSQGVIGSEVNLAARVEPVIVPGEVWTTEAFAHMISNHESAEKLAFDDLGPRQLAKNHGSKRLLRLRRTDETAALSASIENAIKAETRNTELRRAFDVIAIGALNTDFIASATSLRKLNPALIAEHEQYFELGKERPADRDEVRAVIEKIGTSILVPCLGGSSFNTIHALARSLPELTLGFVGVAGTSRAPIGFRPLLESLNVDCQLIKNSGAESGVCVSYISRGERSLLTWPGANTEIASYLRDQREEIISALGRARLVHVTSLFDHDSPPVLAGILREAKNQNPWLQISFDPGHDWVRRVKSGDQGGPIKEILDLSTYLFLNSTEFGILGSDTEIQDDAEVAEDIFKYLSSQTVLILLKRYDEIRVFHRLHKRLKQIHYFNEPLTSKDIEDATGAGDVFAAGLFIAMLVPGLELRHGLGLGLRLARQKLKHSGSTDFSKFSNIVEEFIDTVYLNK